MKINNGLRQEQVLPQANLNLSYPQHVFLNELNTKFRAYVGGFGSGKTYVGALDLALFALSNPGLPQGYFGATYSSIRDIFYPTIEEACHSLGMTVEIKEGNKEVHLYSNGKYYGVIICRSMDRPSSIIGFKIARAMVDEIDTLPMMKAKHAWRMIIARLRFVVDGVVNGVGLTTTPEGYKFAYQTFAEEPTESYSMVQASTYENERYLPPDYIESLVETYPKSLIDAYLMGEFCNLTQGSVFSSYDRAANASNETIQPGEPLFIGCDFNVTRQCAIVYVCRGEEWHAVDELIDMYDTPEMVRIITERYVSHQIYIYPDASGRARKTVNASTSDIALLEQAGFTIRAKKANPAVKDRIMATNAAFDRGYLRINNRRCEMFAKSVEQLAYDNNGEPDKKSGLDHATDAGTYLVAYEMPIVKPVAHIPINFSI